MEPHKLLIQRATELYCGSQLEANYEKTVRIIAKSPLPYLANHLQVVLFSFGYFTLLSWFIYYFLAPKLMKYEGLPNKGKTSVDQLNHGGSLRVKWPHMILSFIHALAIGGVGASFWFQDIGLLSRTMNSRLFGFSESFGTLFAFSAGYKLTINVAKR